MTKFENALLDLLIAMFNAEAGNEELQQILFDIEVWEGGNLRQEADGAVWVTGDNGTAEITRFLKPLLF